MPCKVHALAQAAAEVACGVAAEAQDEEARGHEGGVQKDEHGRLEGEVREKLVGAIRLKGGREGGKEGGRAQLPGRPLITTLLLSSKECPLITLLG